ncbi:hypothetical protein EDD37DRAFT_467344 [Exophiala viscosa]|uniref:uncharacterized protein n=1 Tax=Exophiala viscosa TaxID=2486360 RepID=UPI00218DFB94|nr:hypothetical protein EDD37DRAFT_467344 [Exophiala viscosa]
MTTAFPSAMIKRNSINQSFEDGMRKRNRNCAPSRHAAEKTTMTSRPSSKSVNVSKLSSQPSTGSSSLASWLKGVTASGITNFNPLIVKGFGYSVQRTNLLAAPQAAVGIAGQVIFSILAYYIPNTRCLWWMIGTLPALVGAVIIHTVDVNTQRTVALGGVYLMGFYNVGFVMAIAIATANTRRSTKRPFVNASMGVSLAVSEIFGPQFFRNSQAPYYSLGIWALVVCYAIMVVTGGIYWLLAVLENRKRDRVGQAADFTPISTDKDLTDGQNKAHRYSY